MLNCYSEVNGFKVTLIIMLVDVDCTHCSLFKLDWLFIFYIFKLLHTAAVAALPVEWGSAVLSPGWVVMPAHVLDANAGFPEVSPYMHNITKHGNQ